MSGWNKIIALVCFTALLFPPLTGFDEILTKSSIFSRVTALPLMLLLAIFIPVLIKNFADDGGKQLARVYGNTFRVTVPFLMVALISIIWALHPGAYWGEGIKVVLTDLYNWFLMILSVAIAQSWTMRKYNRIIFFIILAGACIGIWTDMISPGTFSDLAHRAAGFSGNSNWGSRIILFLAIASIDWKKNDAMNLIILVISGLAIFATLSIGSLLLYFAMVIYYLIVHLKGKSISLGKLALIIVIPLLIFFVVPPLLNTIISGDTFDNRTSSSRIEEMTEMFQGDATFAEDHERKNLALEYLFHIQTAPVFGKGTGFIRSQESGPHNMYLKLWVENGLPGLFLYLLLIGSAFRHFQALKDARGMIFIFVFFWAGFLDHNLLNYRTFNILLGIFAGLAYLENSKRSDLSSAA